MNNNIRIESVNIIKTEQSTVTEESKKTTWNGRHMSLSQQFNRWIENVKTAVNQFFASKATRQDSPSVKQQNKSVSQQLQSNIKVDFAKSVLTSEAKPIIRSADKLQQEMRKPSISFPQLTRSEAEFLLNSQNGPAWLLRYTTNANPPQIVVSCKNDDGKISHIFTLDSDMPKSYAELKEDYTGYTFISPEQLKKPLSWEKIPIDFTKGYIFSVSSKKIYKNFKAFCQRAKIEYKFKFNDKEKTFTAACSKFELCALVSQSDAVESLIGNATNRNIFNVIYIPGIKFQQQGENLLKSQNKLLEKSKDFFAKFSPKSALLTLSTPPEQLTTQQLISDVFKEHEGCFIGEDHSHISPKKFLINHIQQLKQEGVRTLFLEHIPSETMQSELDYYFNSPDIEMPPNLAFYLDHQDKGQLVADPQWGFKALVKEAKLAGIRVVAIDTEASYDILSGQNRFKAMNYQAYQIIEKEKQNGKYIALVGSAHVCQNKDVYGLSELLGQPNIIIADASETKIFTNVKQHLNELQGSVNVYLRQKV